MRRLSCSLLAGVLICTAGALGQQKQLVDYVNPNIGGIGHLLQPTYPTVQMPYGMMRISPATTPGIVDRYLADKIYGFPLGAAMLMPIARTPAAETAGNASLYDHDLETATPYYYAVTLEDNGVEVEYTVSERAAYFRSHFPANAPAHILFTAPKGAALNLAGAAVVTAEGGATVTSRARPGNAGSTYAEFSEPPASTERVADATIFRERRPFTEPGSGILLTFKPGPARRIGVRAGISYISLDQAKRNLAREIPDWNFARVRAHAREVWNRALGRISVKGGTEAERTIFYTALYRALCRPANTEEDGKYYSPGDRKVHPSGGHGFYPASGGLWGSHRSLHPLQYLLDPDKQLDFVRSFLALYDQTGRMLGTGRNSMIGHHVAGLMLDSYRKGGRDFDVVKALEGLKKNALEATMLPWHDGPPTALDRVYYEKGFFPALGKGEKESVPEVNSFERRQAVSVTLEAAYDDWATAQMAKIANRPDDYALFMKRAHNYRNVFDPRVGFMAPKTADGNWKYEPGEFNPVWAGGQGGRDYYTEMNAWIYTFYVPHDIAGLIELIGGREKFAAKLDALFTEQYAGTGSSAAREGFGAAKYFFLARFPDQTGLIGNYAQGNEPSFPIPYLYNYAGQPWKTQRKVREIMRLWFNDGPLGISGDEDNGEESSWYAFSAMGFFPVCPGQPLYAIGSPIFAETKIALPGGKAFTVIAHNVSAKNKYIQSATLDGKPLTRPWFDHTDLAQGATIVFEMGPRPNTSWGSAPEAAPPSMSSPIGTP